MAPLQMSYSPPNWNYPTGIKLPMQQHSAESPEPDEQPPHRELEIQPMRTFYIDDVEEMKKQLLKQEDTDSNCQITIEDRGPKTFRVGMHSSGGVLKDTIKGNYAVSTLLQELAMASDRNSPRLVLSETQLRQNPVDKINYMISNYFWPSLRRTIDERGLQAIRCDPKAKRMNANSTISCLYVPYDDWDAYVYYATLSIESLSELRIIRLPAVITPEYIASTIDQPGLLTLALRPQSGSRKLEGVPFYVPGGRFNEMYGWDSYFIFLGLMVDGLEEEAAAIAENLLYEIRHYGKILNANRSYYLGRSQPPFLSDIIVRLVRQRVPSSSNSKDEETHYRWLAAAINTLIAEYEKVWMSEPRNVAVFGNLSRYAPETTFISPETEASHFDAVLTPYAKKHGLSIEQFRRCYSSGEIKEPHLDEYFFHDQAVRESGHDTTYRLDGVAAHLLTIDLNSLLYKYEEDLERLTGVCAMYSQKSGKSLGIVHPESKYWAVRKENRRAQVTRLLWNEREGLFFDFNFVSGRQSTYKSVTNYYALWSGLATMEQATRLRQNLAIFEGNGGLASGSKDSLEKFPVSLENPSRQWDYPYGWAPHQILTWIGLQRYGFEKCCRRLAYKWLFLITKTFCDFNGMIPEKYDVIGMTHKCTAEYGNVGTDFRYVPREGFGWVNASYKIGQTYLQQNELDALRILMSPDAVYLKLV